MERTAERSIRRVPRAVLMVLLAVCLSPLAEAVKCYCTDDHCVPYGACEGNACLVGILKESNQVIRTCGNQKIGCFRDVDEKWADLCVCADEFCNTFSFLRQSTQKDKSAVHSPYPPSEHHAPSSLEESREEDRASGGGSRSHYPHSFKTPYRSHHDMPIDDGDAVFQRMDRPDDGYTHDPHAPTATSFLTILLVVVPLTVGAATVVVVAFNYYCHLC